MAAAEQRDYWQAALARSHRHLDYHRPNAACRDDDKGIVRAEMKSFQNLLRVALVLFEVKRRSQSVAPDNRRVIRERKLDQRDKSHVASLPRRHLFAHHAGVAIAEQEYQA